MYLSFIFLIMSMFSGFRHCDEMSSRTEDEEKKGRRGVVRQDKLPELRRRDRRPSRCRENDSRRFGNGPPLSFHISSLSGSNSTSPLPLLLITMNFPSAAQDEMAGVGLGISDELISLEIASPDVPDLTLIDLPGIARVAVKGQPENIGEQVSVLCTPPSINQSIYL